MTLSEQLKEQRKQNMSQQDTMQRTSTKLSEQLKVQRQNANINPVVSTLKNASVIQTANDVKAPVLTEETLKQQKNTKKIIIFRNRNKCFFKPSCCTN
jgi:hypothetical protein